MSSHGFLMAALILLAVVVAAAIPALYQLYQTLKRARTLLETAGPRLERALAHMDDAASRLDAIGATLETRARGAAASRSIDWLKRAAMLGSAFAPAAAAGARAFFSKSDGRRRFFP